MTIQDEFDRIMAVVQLNIIDLLEGGLKCGLDIFYLFLHYSFIVERYRLITGTLIPEMAHQNIPLKSLNRNI